MANAVPGASAQGNYYPPPPNNPYPNAQPYGGLQPQPNYGGAPYAQPNYLGAPLAQPNYAAAPLIYPGQPVAAQPMPLQYLPPPPMSPSDRKWAYLQMGMAVFVVVLSIVDLCLNWWIRYCGARISLSDWYSDGESGSLSDAKDLLCDNLDYDIGLCGNPCTNYEKLAVIGPLMKSLGWAATSSTLFSILRMFLLLVRPGNWCQSCRMILMRISLVLATGLWILGMVIYAIVYGSMNGDEVSAGPGFVLSILIACAHVVHCIVGNIAVNKIQ